MQSVFPYTALLVISAHKSLAQQRTKASYSFWEDQQERNNQDNWGILRTLMVTRNLVE